MLNFNIEYYNYIAVALSLCLLCGAYYMPRNFQGFFPVYSDNRKNFFKYLFYIFFILLIASNFMLFMSQPSVREDSTGIARQNEDVIVTDIFTGRKFVFGSELYRTITFYLTEEKYTELTRTIWDNIFFINSSYILGLSLYIFIVRIFFNVIIMQRDFS